MTQSHRDEPLRGGVAAQVTASPALPLILTLTDAEATDALGAAIAPALRAGMVVFLSGQLGAGKTSLTRAMLRALGFEGRVKSPTYTLVELYTISRLNFYHFDFYRFNDPHEWVEAGFRDLFNEESVCLVEWPERAGGLLPRADLVIHLGISGAGREATLTANSEKGKQCIRAAEAHGGGTSGP